MPLFVKYPYTQAGLNHFKSSPFVEIDKVKKCDGFVVVYPWSQSVNGKPTVYARDNKAGFYCKSMNPGEIMYLKGNFQIEKCSQQELHKVGRAWYYGTRQRLPRKTKKKIIGTL